MQFSERIGRRMKLHDLHVLMAVVQAGSMSKAAPLLNTTQSAISRSIAELEQTIGVPLLDRSAQGVEPTHYGRALLKRSLAAFDELKQGIRDIEFLADPTAGEVRIACLPVFTATILPQVVERFVRQYSRVVVHQDDVTFLAEQFSGLRERKYDLTLSRLLRPLTHEEDDLNAEVLFNDRTVLTAGMHTGWARRRKVNLAELIDEPWLLTAPGTWNYQRVMEAFQARELPMPKSLSERKLNRGNLL
jgi:DNA-binding transcriptional LysR family regulator